MTVPMPMPIPMTMPMIVTIPVTGHVPGHMGLRGRGVGAALRVDRGSWGAGCDGQAGHVWRGRGAMARASRGDTIRGV